MSTGHPTASPRAPRGKQQPPQSPAQSSQNNAGRQSQRKPRGNRAHNPNHQHNGNAASPIKIPPGTSTTGEGATHAGGDAQASWGPRNTRKHTHSQPSIDRVISPSGAHNSLNDPDSVASNLSATPAKNQGAYAGPTFHASPAPSALPIPKFLSKSVPAKTRTGPPTPPPEDSSDSANTPSPSTSPSRAPVHVPQRSEFSPLDMLFKADQAEKANHFQGNSSSGNFSSPSRPRPAQHDSYNSSHGVFPIELEGDGKNTYMSPSPVPSPAGQRSVTDPHTIPQIKDITQQPSGNDVMQDLMNRLSMSQKQHASNTPPRPDVQAPSDPQSRKTPSPFHDGRPLVRSTSGPSTPQQTHPEGPDFFYGNRNLSPLFKAAKVDSPKRNSGLRTEVTVDSPMVLQDAFQEHPAQRQPMMDPNAFSRGNMGHDGQGYPDARRGSVPFSPPFHQSPNYQHSPNRGRGTPRGQTHHARGRDFQGRGNHYGNNHRGGRAAGPLSPASASAPKPTTSMMSFVPASVAAKAKPKQTPTATPPVVDAPKPSTMPTAQDKASLEQDLKRLLNLKSGDSSSTR